MGGRAVDPALKLEMGGANALCVAFVDGAAQPTGQRLHRRAVAQVLEPLASGTADALLLLLDVRHDVKNARIASGRHGTSGGRSYPHGVGNRP